jgi:hypothetical protein
MSGEIKTLQARSCDNLADLFAKPPLASNFCKCIYGIGVRRLKRFAGFRRRPTLKNIDHDCDPEDHKSVLKTLLRASTAVLFSLDEFFPTRFSHARF